MPSERNRCFISNLYFINGNGSVILSYGYIFWDFNGTLIDDVGNALACVNDMLARKNRKPITLADYYTYVETPIIGFYRHILPPEELDFDEISKEYHADYARHMSETHLADGAYELVHELKNKGVHQYIITANHTDEVVDLTDKFGITDCFDEISGADNHFADSKTERAKKLFESLDINRNDAVFIGDTLHDLETANALGIDCVLVSYGHQGRKLLEEHNAYTVNGLAEVKKIICGTKTVDLHTHSTYSDGTLTPQQLVNLAKESGLSVFALTDHDSVDGIKEAAKEAVRVGIEFIPGIEFSAAEDTQTHIIGLFVDPENETLLQTVRKLRGCRRNRIEQICRNLKKLGIDISYSEALEISGSDFVGRAHIAKVAVDKGYCKTVKECFDKYIGLGKPAYVEKTELTAVEAVKAIKAAGGLAFLAHLHQTDYDIRQLEVLLKQLKDVGLDGVEGYYTEYTPVHIIQYRALAEKLSLILSGGSDYHGALKPHISIGTGTGNLRIPYYIVDNMKGVLKRQNAKTENSENIPSCSE